MRIVTAYFSRDNNLYENMKEVFLRSGKEHMPKANFKILKLNPPKEKNHQNDAAICFFAVINYVLKQNKSCIVTGIDSMFLKSLGGLLEKKFDFAITVRKHRVKYNTGLWAYHPTPKSHIFLENWMENTELLIDKFDKFENSIRMYGGIDQLSLLITLLQDKNNLNVLELPCKEWNATQSEWENIDNKTRMVHIKSELRRLVTQKEEIEYDKTNYYLESIIEKWREYLNCFYLMTL